MPLLRLVVQSSEIELVHALEVISRLAVMEDAEGLALGHVHFAEGALELFGRQLLLLLPPPVSIPVSTENALVVDDEGGNHFVVLGQLVLLVLQGIQLAGVVEILRGALIGEH